KENGVVDVRLVEMMNIKSVEVGKVIYHKRKVFMEKFTPSLHRHYQYLSENAEEVTLQYESQLHGMDFMHLLEYSLDKDRILERTTQGIHKDDLLFTIHGEMALKKFGSQGQQKSFLIALKLAQYTYLQEQDRKSVV